MRVKFLYYIFWKDNTHIPLKNGETGKKFEMHDTINCFECLRKRSTLGRLIKCQIPNSRKYHSAKSSKIDDSWKYVHAKFLLKDHRKRVKYLYGSFGSITVTFFILHRNMVVRPLNEFYGRRAVYRTCEMVHACDACRAIFKYKWLLLCCPPWLGKATKKILRIRPSRMAFKPF